MIRAGLAGFGLGGRVFHAPLISSIDGMELAAIVERTSNHAAERYPGIKTVHTLEDLLADPTLDLIVISTPSGAHFDQARQALEAGKNLVVDKPMCTNSADIAKLIKLAARKKVLLSAFHERRWDSEFQTTQKLLREGHLGRLVHFESTLDRWSTTSRVPWKDNPELGGGVLLDLGTHLVDQALALFGKPQSIGAEVLRERDGTGADDAFTLRMRYPGISVTLACSSLSSLARPRLHLRGTKGNFPGSGCRTRRRPSSAKSPASTVPPGVRSHPPTGARLKSTSKAAWSPVPSLRSRATIASTTPVSETLCLARPPSL